MLQINYIILDIAEDEGSGKAIKLVLQRQHKYHVSYQYI